jgi:hypothetical protein
MIRIETETDWLLLPHADHAALAGEFARHWKNRSFFPPDPFAHVLDAVARHDDSWAPRDAQPDLTEDGHPAAFSKELVGTYDAFEDIDLEGYLRVRGQATERAAERDSYSAILISMHTVNLLTEQADLSGLSETDRQIHATFIDGQRNRQRELVAELANTPLTPYLTEESLQRNFEFLQACDSFSLLVGVDYPEASQLRHSHPTYGGTSEVIRYTPLGDHRYALSPWPLDEGELTFQIPYRRVAKTSTATLEEFRTAYTASTPEMRTITIIPAS